MTDKTYKNLLDDGYTTYHDDGTQSVTYRNLLNDGYTTYHSDGRKSETYKNFLYDGYTTYHSDGSNSETYKNILNEGYTTYHSNGGKSETYHDFFGDGYTTYNYEDTTKSGLFIPNVQSENRTASEYSSISGYSRNHFYGCYDKSIPPTAVLIFAVFGLFAWMYSKTNAIIPLLVLGIEMVISLKLGRKSDQTAVIFRACLFYFTVAMGFIFIVNNRVSPDYSPLLNLICYISPFFMICLLFFLTNIMDFEDLCVIPCNFLFFFLMTISWFGEIIYNHHCMFIYTPSASAS